jgi:polyisoprenyl-teichoic acid--peptidoglycan teichoic acid transferase
MNSNNKINSVAADNTSIKKNGVGVIALILLVLISVAGAIFMFKDNIQGVFNPISIVANVTTINLKETDGRTNILILGTDRRTTSNEGNDLTDTILVASIGKLDKDVVLISLPRDLWVTWTDDYGNKQQSKINEIYPLTGGDSQILIATIQDVLGMPIHYYGSITFDLFQKVINILGGIDVDVETSFTDYEYPVEGKEADPIMANRYETISFSKGITTMDGETALKYVRSRHGDNNEGTDFARSKRQQKVIEAVKKKVFSTKTLLNIGTIKELYDAYKDNVDTNIDFSTIQSFYLLSQQIEFDQILSIVLDDRSDANEGGLLYSPEDSTPYQGKYVLVPQAGDFSQIHAYVKKYLFGDK